MEQGNQIGLSFARISGKRVEADFEGGNVTSDGGALFLRETESTVGILSRIVSALIDRRHPSYVDHSLEVLIKQRVYQIACGYEDANDCDDLRRDPGIKAACDRLPVTGDDLACQSTMSRLENSVTRKDLYRLARAFVDTFIASYTRAPKAIILDIDDTDDPTHGAQQLSMFNAHFDTHCFMPLHIYEGQSGKLITTILRPGHPFKGTQIVTILKRLIPYIRIAWPNVEIFLRGDSKFSSPAIHDFCEDNKVYYVLGQATNKKLKALGRPLMEQAQTLAEHGKPVRLFESFDYQARSWRQARRIIYKAEVTLNESNPRFVVTNLQSSRAQFVYERIYCARGRMEGFIKDHKTFLHSDRTSCHRFEANQFRLLLHSAAYVLLHTLREKGLSGTSWATAQFNTIQNRFLKVGARVVERITKVQFHFPTSYPLKHVMKRMRDQLQLAPP